jgi:alanyl-tRNA synthetase
MFFYFPTFSIYQLMAEEKKLQVDVEGFNKAMEAARERSRTAQNKVSCLLQCLFMGQKSF